ncbi:1,4-alpha-glucan branching protein domain-containing protein [Conexibacter stalactiti]|uniref:1,4-alpha-glucan branching protein domain-containing protein n=1 Tax=Conexibacter stalactiti TaxID=1940611 RepID=A0ABU4HTZ4_9ACTN|nr:1,4-alpha-glucan branching protein domain-containing protein [Conexibacter stalactiti]MDW5596664.1 1,4-alpha-glucan branching protein domain-containing protein [Conexibacter stalactiti]MEC5037306.1 1,4-alpha-glucan branching protein domain-containing protein [Conexibacter stalactiti]
MAAASDRGELALVLHTHMPYVEGYGTWPFGEEWLWEAIATCYLPLLELLDRRGGDVTLSLTPVLADQLAAPGLADRFAAFLRDVRRETHRIDVAGCREAGREEWAAELERAAGDYERALARVEALERDGRGLLGAFAPHAAWTSSATHAVLPLLATDAGVRLQLETGIASHRARFDGPARPAGGPPAAGAAPANPAHEWRGGFWLPECGHAPWLDPLLEEAGVHAVCVDLTDVLGRGSTAQLAPLQSADGPLLVPIDRATMELVWSDDGYPAHGLYRDYHAFTVHHHRVWSNAGETYDPAAARAQARRDAADFVARTIARLDAGAAALGRPALAVCAVDTELLGHWWYEGIDWLEAVLDEAAAQGLRIAHLDDALQRHPAVPVAEALAADLPTTTWGTPRDLSTWDAPRVADLAWQARALELRTLGGTAAQTPPSPRALRELLAVQASDWAFQVTRELAGPYPRERAAGHAAALEAALAAGADPRDDGAVRNLAPHLPR